MRFVRPFQPASAATLALAAIALLSGCASIDFDQPKSVTHAFDDTDGTFLGKQIDGLAEQHPGESGFYLQADGIEALASRILLAERAERSIDTQYYLIKDDVASHAFLSALLRAADRGVRVRLLVDDMFMAGNDAGIAGLDSHPNFEIRVFNPFARRSARFADGITSFSRINRRMHNKSFTIDNQVTIIGGRNIADEYFAARADVNFGDLDVLTIGPIVNEVSAMFDGYWNHERAAPVEMFADLPDDPAAELERVRGILEASAENIATSRYADAVRAERQHPGVPGDRSFAHLCSPWSGRNWGSRPGRPRCADPADPAALRSLVRHAAATAQRREVRIAVVDHARARVLHDVTRGARLDPGRVDDGRSTAGV